MGLNNELKALHGCDFHAWKQIEHGPALCVGPRLGELVPRVQDTMRVILIKKHSCLPWARKQVYSTFLAQGKHKCFLIRMTLMVSCPVSRGTQEARITHPSAQFLVEPCTSIIEGISMLF